MKKIKLYSIISVLITVILFGTAAICNQCGITPTTETNVTVITQAAEITEETTAATTAKTTAATTAKTTAATTAATTATTTATTTAATTAATRETTPPLSFTFNPKLGPGGTEVKLSLSAPVTSPMIVSMIVYYNNKALPKSISADSKTLTVTIPVGASSGFFMLEYDDGKRIQAAEKFTVTAPPQADLVITSIIPASTTGEGNIYVAIKNVGTADLNNTDIHVICHADGRLRSDLTKTKNADSDEWIKSSLPAGGNAGFHPSMVIDVSLYTYTVVYCNFILDGDPTPDNNLFSISIP